MRLGAVRIINNHVPFHYFQTFIAIACPACLLRKKMSLTSIKFKLFAVFVSHLSVQINGELKQQSYRKIEKGKWSCIHIFFITDNFPISK